MASYANQVIHKIEEQLVQVIENEMMSKSVWDLEALINELEATSKQYKLSAMAENVLTIANAEYIYRMNRLNKVGIAVTK